MLRITTAHRLATTFWPDFEDRGGAVLFAGTQDVRLSNFNSLTEAESFHSHTHVFDLFRHAIPFVHDAEWDSESPDPTHPEFTLAWDLAQRIGQMWLHKLMRDFPEERFRVYVTKLDEPIVRFHRVRGGEPPWYADEDAAEQISRGEVVIYDSLHLLAPGVLTSGRRR